MKSITLTQKDIARFWSHVEIKSDNECWRWTRRANNKGYGMMGINQGLFLCSRISWTINRGPIPQGMCVCHKCDNPICVNPNHLFLGTMRDNMIDKAMKGRARNGVSRGEAHKLSKLHESDIPKIREMFDAGMTTREIGNQFGVDSKTIWSVGKRISWPHIKSGEQNG